MSDIEKFKKENMAPVPPVNTYKVVAPKALLAENSFKKTSYPTESLRKRIGTSALDSFNEVATSANAIKSASVPADALTNMAKSVSGFAKLAKSVNKLVVENQTQLNKPFEPILRKSDTFNNISNLQILSPQSEMLQELKSLNEQTERNIEISSQTSEALVRASEINEQTLAALIDLNKKIDTSNQAALESSQQAKVWRDEDLISSKKSLRIGIATLIATVAGIIIGGLITVATQFLIN